MTIHYIFQTGSPFLGEGVQVGERVIAQGLASTLTYLTSTYLSTSISNIISTQKLSDSLALSNHFLFLEHFGCHKSQHPKTKTWISDPRFINCVIMSRSSNLFGILSSFVNGIIVLLSFLPYSSLIHPQPLSCNMQCLPLWVECTSFASCFRYWPCDSIWLMDG